MATKQEETFFQKEIRLKARKQVFKATYKKGLFMTNKYQIENWVKQDDVIVRVHSGGNLDDDTEFINITIEGFKKYKQ